MDNAQHVSTTFFACETDLNTACAKSGGVESAGVRANPRLAWMSLVVRNARGR